MIVEPKFYSNLPDNNHCLQAVVMMVLNSLVGETTWDEVNRITDYEEGLYSWTPRAAVALDQKIKGVKLISKLDYGTFAKHGESYLRQFMSPEWFELQSFHASEAFKREQQAAIDCVSQNLFEHLLTITQKDIYEWLKDHLLIALVNSKVLKEEPGAAGHLVVVYTEENEKIFLHDPGLPPHPSWAVPVDRFMKSFKGDVILVPKGNRPFGLKLERNEPCWCKSGKKHKNCCGK